MTWLPWWLTGPLVLLIQLAQAGPLSIRYEDLDPSDVEFRWSGRHLIQIYEGKTGARLWVRASRPTDPSEILVPGSVHL